MAEIVRACTDRVLTARQQYDATVAALEERPGNAVSGVSLGDAILAIQSGTDREFREQFAGGSSEKRLALVSFNQKRFRNGRILKVHFMDGPTWARDLAFKLLIRWGDVANLHFERTRDASAADIRIAFRWDTGAWSYLGADIFGIPVDEPTMSLGWLLDVPDDFEEWRRVIVHEGGHTLSFGHEQAHPQGNIDWNYEAVYAAYGGPPNYWSRAQVQAQVFRKYAGAPVTNFSAYDRMSIMHYPIPAKFVLDLNDVVGWNTSRSVLDRRYAALWYPKPIMQEAIQNALDQMAREAEQRLNDEE
jgi:serralysin